MNKISIGMLLIFCFGLVSCGSGSSKSSDKVVSKTFDDFKNEVRQSSGEGATNCGVVEVGDSQVEANTCVAAAFVNNEAFYAVYELQGIDSSVGAAWSGRSNGEISRWSFDSNPGGGVPAKSSTTTKTLCANPTLSGSLDSGYQDIFTC